MDQSERDCPASGADRVAADGRKRNVQIRSRRGWRGLWQAVERAPWRSRLWQRLLPGLLWLLFGLMPAGGMAASTEEGLEVAVRYSAAEVRPGETFTMTLSLEEEGDLHDFFMTIEFQSDRIEFVSVENVGITEYGLHVGGMITSNRAGLGVSRADDTPISASGDFMEVTFRVRDLADMGDLDFTFLSPEMSDSDGEELDMDLQPPPDLPLVEGIGAVEMTVPPGSSTVEGEGWSAEGRVYASGISTDPERAGELETWIGIHPDQTHPESWPQEAWIEVTPGSEPEDLSEEEKERYLWYRGQVADRREPGEWHLAIRTRMEGEPWHYGGQETLSPDGPVTLPQLEITPQPQFRYSLAEWDFETGRLTPARFTADNDTSRIRPVGNPPLEEPAETSRSNGIDWLDTKNWQPVEGRQKALQAVISTRGYQELRFSASHTATSAGPAEFRIQLSGDGVVWEDLEDGEIDLSQTSVVELDEVVLDQEWEDLDRLWIRWLKTSGRRVDGDEAPISNSSYFRIGRVRISGLNPEPDRISVLPGDANGDGVVNAEDVLALGYHWLTHGPLPAYDFLDFEPRRVEAWRPSAATHADTNGDGVVDHRDLKAVGLNFGRQVSSPQQLQAPERIAESGRGDEEEGTGVDTGQTAAEGGAEGDTEAEPTATGVRLPALQSGGETVVTLQVDRREKFRGVAFRMQLEPVTDGERPAASRPPATASEEPSRWDLELERLPAEAEERKRGGELLTFSRQEGQTVEAAWSLQGRREEISDYHLVTFRIRAASDWERPARLRLEWLSLGRADGSAERLEAVEMRQSEAEPPELNLPDEEEMTLYQNYPNPFRPQTTIRYYLPERQPVRLDVYNPAGRRVATLIDTEQDEGIHSVRFTPAGLASGIYFYRLQSGRQIRTRKMVLVR